MIRTVVLMGIILAGMCSFAADAAKPERPQAVREHLEWYKDQKLGLFMHLGVYSSAGLVESWPMVDADASWSRFETTGMTGDAFRKFYFALNRGFNPVLFDPQEWAAAAVEGGFRYVIFTTKHHDGFCLYDTKYTDYKVTASECPYSANPHADMVKALFDACRHRGLGIGAYFSKADWHSEDYWENHGVGYHTTRHPTYDPRQRPEKWTRFRAFTRNQMLELTQNYGPLDFFWLDAGWCHPDNHQDLEIEKIIGECRQTVPGLLAVGLDSNSACDDVEVVENKLPDRPILDHAWETCRKTARYWSYHYDATYRTAHEVIPELVEIVAKGGNLALNVGPMPNGRLPEPALKLMRDIGVWLKYNGTAIYSTRPHTPYFKDGWGYTVSKTGTVYAIRVADASSGKTLSVASDSPVQQARYLKHLRSNRFLPVVVTGEGATVKVPDDIQLDLDADAFEVIF